MTSAERSDPSDLCQAHRRNIRRVGVGSRLSLTGRGDEKQCRWLSAAVATLENTSRVAERMGQLADAIGCEERYRATKPELDPREADELRGRLSRLRDQLQNLPRAARAPERPPWRTATARPRPPSAPPAARPAQQARPRRPRHPKYQPGQLAVRRCRLIACAGCRREGGHWWARAAGLS